MTDVDAAELVREHATAWLSDPVALAQFDELAIDWGRRNAVMVSDVPALRILYRALPDALSVKHRQRLMYLAFDIKVAAANAAYHINELAGTENKYLVHDIDRKRYRPLTDAESFRVAMQRSRGAFAMVSRVRALWDKLFLYTALRFDSEDAARRLQNRRSKRKYFFSTYGKGIGQVSSEKMDAALQGLNELERKYRSPELHGFGVIPPWVFQAPDDRPWRGEGHTSPILSHWSTMDSFLYDTFFEANGKRTSFDAPDGPDERRNDGRATGQEREAT